MSSVGQALGGAVGAVAGFFIGGPSGAYYGAQIGMTIGGIIDPPKGPKIQGPRLSDLSVQTATYGAFIPRIYGTIALNGNIFWLENNKLKEVETKEEQGGKGGPPASEVTTWSYYATFAVGLSEGPIIGVRRIWVGSKLVYDAGSSDISTLVASNETSGLFTLHLGTETQLANTRMQSTLGVANTPAYRGLAYIVFNDYPLADHSNSLAAAQVKVEVVASGSVAPQLTQQASIVTRDQPYVAAISGVYAYVVNHGFPRFLQVFDVSNPVLPVLVNDIAHTSAAPIDIEVNVEDRYLLVLYSTSAVLEKYDISNPSNPVLIGTSTSISGGPRAFALNVDYAYVVANTYNFIRVYNVNGIVPQVVYEVASTAQLWSVAVAGNYLYAITQLSLMYVYDILINPGIPILVGSVTIGTTANDIAVSGNYAYVISSASNILQVIDVSNPAFPVVVGSVVTAGAQGQIKVVGNYACVSNFNSSTIQIFNISNPTAPVLVTSATTGNNPFGVYIFNGYIYVCGNGTDTFQVWVFFDNKITSNLANLSSIVSAECLSSKLLTAPDIDVTALTSTVRGYRISSIGAIRGGIEPLQGAWPFDAVQAGYKIKFIPRGQASVATIPIEKLDARAAGDQPGVQITNVREMDSVLPRKVSIKYFDSEREYDQGEQYAERLNTDAVNIKDLEMAIVFITSEAAQKADVLLYLYWLERYDVSFSLPPEYVYLEPADVITITSSAATYNLRLTQINYTSDGRMECVAKYNNAATYTSTATGEAGQSTGALLKLKGASLYELMDIPLVQDVYNISGYPVAMTGYLSGWPGGVLYRSDDAGQTWMDVQGFNSPGSTIGYATNTLAVHPGTLIDKTGRMTARLYQGALFSITELQMLNGANHFAYGFDGRWEIIAAQNCVLQGDGSYVLTDFLRGRFGTEIYTGTHAVNDRLIYLSSAQLAFVLTNTANIGIDKKYRGITSGKEIDSDVNRSFTYRGVNLECLNPVYLNGNRHPTNNDWTLNWIRRTRIGGEWRDLVDATLGETVESYEVEIYDGAAYTTVRRALAAATATAPYTSAQQVTDFGSNQTTLYVKIYQISGVVGRGYPLTTSISR